MKELAVQAFLETQKVNPRGACGDGAFCEVAFGQCMRTISSQ